MAVWKSYRREVDYSYTLGAFPTFELMRRRPEQVQALLMHPSFTANEAAVEVERFATERGIPLQVESKALDRLSPKENCYLIGVFAKYDALPLAHTPNLVLDRPANAGNLGTIMRSMLGFAMDDLILLRPAVDLFDPRVVRASMGAFFGLRWVYYDSIEEYLRAFPEHLRYSFMLNSQFTLRQAPNPDRPYSLIFGNEATGLDESYRKLGPSIVIPHESEIDSLNLPLAVGIALHEFYERKQQKSR